MFVDYFLISSYMKLHASSSNLLKCIPHVSISLISLHVLSFITTLNSTHVATYQLDLAIYFDCMDMLACVFMRAGGLNALSNFDNMAGGTPNPILPLMLKVLQ